MIFMLQTSEFIFYLITLHVPQAFASHVEEALGYLGNWLEESVAPSSQTTLQAYWCFTYVLYTVLINKEVEQVKQFVM